MVKALNRLDKYAFLMDAQWRIPLTDFRFGISGPIGVIPYAGDTVAAVLSLAPIAESFRFHARITNWPINLIYKDGPTSACNNAWQHCF